MFVFTYSNYSGPGGDRWPIWMADAGESAPFAKRARNGLLEAGGVLRATWRVLGIVYSVFTAPYAAVEPASVHTTRQGV